MLRGKRGDQAVREPPGCIASEAIERRVEGFSMLQFYAWIALQHAHHLDNVSVAQAERRFQKPA